MAKRKNTNNDARVLGWLLVALIVFELIYFTVVNPEALSPMFVTIITALLITVRAIYRIGVSDDDEGEAPEAPRGIGGIAAKVAKKALDKVADSERPSHGQQDDSSVQRTGYIWRRHDRPAHWRGRSASA